jgi:hypothetical protein
MKNQRKLNLMTNAEIRKKIIDLEDKISDARYYISSDGCQTCERMYNDIQQFQKEIQQLKEQISNI